MKLKGKVAVVTGGANGIGRALCLRFGTEGAEKVIVADIDFDRAKSVADEINGLAFKTNVAVESDIIKLKDAALDACGRIDLFCSNAGIGGIAGGEEVPNDAWQEIWETNVMAHIYAARAVIPHMLERGEGYLLNTASAAGVLTQIGSAPYSVTKHAAVSFAEWLSIKYGDLGIGVSCLCPQGVRTNMLQQSSEAGVSAFLLDGALDPDDVAQSVIEGLEEERFLILPHPEVATYMQYKAGDYDRWIRGMRRLQQKVYREK